MKKLFTVFVVFAISMTTMANTSFEDLLPYKVAKTGITNVSPLCIAIAKGDYDMVKGMIELGSDVNEISNKMTPLMFAARYNQTEIIKLLVANGAIVNKKDNNGKTALNYAKNSNAKDAMVLLEELK
ncbi:ankyrin repeat domain-containing protein [Aquimarina sp. ERC-38]|uniref:ankyrin repeat domain-containing protein n=1 Tax=Aquimarina sp. ERC-38 TaxID=2949996 RepID=UPI0022476E51|nr:ankyrin repeat domain-containing protein [Aquimarina sp. ERC-38]UZO82582.1 ankyrin repeat domain-containing protein [Aquimarina sp. ERC-38]